MNDVLPFDVHPTSFVYVIDDDTSIRDSLADLLASVGLTAVTFATCESFLSHCAGDAPSCIVLDVRMPGMSGMDFHRRLREMGICTPVIFITGHGDIAMGVEAMKNGAIEFLTKPFRDQALLDAVHLGITIDRDRRIKERYLADLKERWQALNSGEQEVAKLVVLGLLNKQIAAQLHLSEITIKVRRGHVMRKMKAKSLAELVRVSAELGL